MAYNPLAFGLMMVAMASLLFVAYLYRRYTKHIDKGQEKDFGGMFTLLGILGGIFGLSIFMHETLPGQYIEVYGVGYMVFTLLMLAAGMSMLFGWDKRPASYLAFLGGIALLNSSYTVMKFGLSKSPLGTGTIFALAGLGSIGTILLTHVDIKKNRWIVILVGLAFLTLGILAYYSGMHAQLGHVESALAALS